MGNFLGIVLILGLITFTAYELINIIKSIKDKKKSKIDNKGVDK